MGEQTKKSFPIIASCFSIQAIGVGVFIAYGVFFNPLMTEFGWSRALVSGASSAAFFVSGLFAIYIGRLNDRIGPRKIMIVTALFFGAGLILMAFADTLFELYLYFGIIFGIGLSPIDVIPLTTVARWFPLKRGIMTGITKVGTGAGQFLFPLVATLFIAAWGWRTASVFLGIVSMILLFGIARVIQRDPGGPGALTGPAEAPAPMAWNISFAGAVKTHQFWMICLANLIIVACLMGVLVHIVPHGRDTGLSPNRAASILSTIGGVSMAGRFITGMAIDRIGSKRSIIFSLFTLITALLLLQKADALWKLYLFAAIYGLAHGSFFTVISPIVAELFGTVSHGSLFGLVVAFGTTGGALGPILTGYLFDIKGSYDLPFFLFLVASILGLGILSLVKPLTSRILPNGKG